MTVQATLQGLKTVKISQVKVRDLYIAKNQKLCQNQNSKWRNFAMAFILNLVNITDTTCHNHIIQLSTPI